MSCHFCFTAHENSGNRLSGRNRGADGGIPVSLPPKRNISGRARAIWVGLVRVVREEEGAAYDGSTRRASWTGQACGLHPAIPILILSMQKKRGPMAFCRCFTQAPLNFSRAGQSERDVFSPWLDSWMGNHGDVSARWAPEPTQLASICRATQPKLNWIGTCLGHRSCGVVC